MQRSHLLIMHHAFINPLCLTMVKAAILAFRSSKMPIFGSILPVSLHAPFLVPLRVSLLVPPLVPPLVPLLVLCSSFRSSFLVPLSAPRSSFLGLHPGPRRLH